MMNIINKIKNLSWKKKAIFIYIIIFCIIAFFIASIQYNYMFKPAPDDWFRGLHYPYLIGIMIFAFAIWGIPFFNLLSTKEEEISMKQFFIYISLWIVIGLILAGTVIKDFIN